LLDKKDMNTVEHPPSVNAHVANAKVSAPSRPQMSDDSGQHTSTPQTVPSLDPNPREEPAKDDSVPTQAPEATGEQASADGPSQTSDEAVESLSEFRSIEEISVDPNTNELLVKVPSEQVGRMIGKNGLVIKELQSQSGAFINMAKEGEVYRLARISGNYPETHLCALLLVQKFTPREDSRKHDKLEQLIRFCKKNRPVKPFIVENFSVPEEHLGRVIGKGGHTLREIQEQSHAKIDLPKAAAASEHHRVLMISGSPEEVAQCRELLKARITPREDGGMAGPEGAHEGHEMHGRSGHEVPSGRPYYPHPYAAQHPYMPPYYATHMPYDQMAAYWGYMYPPYAPSYPMPEHLAADMSRVSISPSADSQDNDHTVPHMHAPGLPGHPGHPGHPGQLHASAPTFVPSLTLQQQHESVIPIPGELVGRLIGRQGVAVKQLQMETKTRVDILDADPNAKDTTRYVRITALRPENVRMCENHIKARIAAHYGNTF